MPTTTKTESLIEALLKVQQEIPEIHTDSTADTGKFKYKYASLPEILKVVLPVLHKNGFVLTQLPIANGEDNALQTELIHVSGERLIASVTLPEPVDWQRWGSAVTYARRYSLTAMLGIAPDDDDDASTAQGASTGRYNAPAPRRDTPAPAANSNDCPEHGLPWRKTSRGNNAHPIKDDAGTLLGWCDEQEWKDKQADKYSDADSPLVRAAMAMGARVVDEPEQEQLAWER